MRSRKGLKEEDTGLAELPKLSLCCEWGSESRRSPRSPAHVMTSPTSCQEQSQGNTPKGLPCFISRFGGWKWKWLGGRYSRLSLRKHSRDTA